MTIDFLALFKANMLFAVALGLMTLMSLYSFILMGWDKRLARRGEWRISERQLLVAGLLMGGPGAWLGMKVFRHKTKHKVFQFGFPVFTILQLAGMLALLFT